MIPARTPVLAGAGQVSERLDEPGYRCRSPVELAADAARAALSDTGADPRVVAEAIGVVAGVRQFEISAPMATVPLGRSGNFPVRSLGASELIRAGPSSRSRGGRRRSTWSTSSPPRSRPVTVRWR